MPLADMLMWLAVFLPALLSTEAFSAVSPQQKVGIATEQPNTRQFGKREPNWCNPDGDVLTPIGPSGAALTMSLFKLIFTDALNLRAQGPD